MYISYPRCMFSIAFALFSCLLFFFAKIYLRSLVTLCYFLLFRSSHLAVNRHKFWSSCTCLLFVLGLLFCLVGLVGVCSAGNAGGIWDGAGAGVMVNGLVMGNG